MRSTHRLCALALSGVMALSCMPLYASAAGAVPAQENCVAIQEMAAGIGDRLGCTLGLTAPRLQAVSTLYGSADTGNKSTLKQLLKKTSGPGDQNIYYYNEEGIRTAYPDGVEVEVEPVQYTGEAVLTLEGSVDDSKIDSSHAVVQIVAGDGYYPEELILHADKLDGAWENGSYHYTLSEGDIEWYTGDYPLRVFNSSREWSVFGGDGNGCYTFTLQVSGIVYDGREVEPATFPVQVYIWGRDASDRVAEFNASPSAAAEPGSSGAARNWQTQWTWVGDDRTGEPILCDNQTDDFFVTWPKWCDASGITAEDVTVTLYNDYGASYQLQAENAYGETQYEVFSSEGETQVAVTFQHWAYTPVFTTMTIEIDGGLGLRASKTYPIDSVYAYIVQQGGGGVTVDGTVTAYSYYGLKDVEDVTQLIDPATYTLSVEQNGATRYYAEDAAGKGYLTEDKAQAKVYDASGAADCNQRLIENTVWVTTRLGQTEEKLVDGQAVRLSKVYSSGMGDLDVAIRNGVAAADGYILENVRREMWSWQDRFLSGYTPDRAEPTGFPYVSFPYGY